MSFFEAMMLVFLRQFATAMSGEDGSMEGKMLRTLQAPKSKLLHAKPSRFELSVEDQRATYQHFYLSDKDITIYIYQAVYSQER
jgi:hypothetical protein